MGKQDLGSTKLRVKYIKKPDHPLGLQVSIGLNSDLGVAYIIYRGNLQELKKAMHITNEFVQMQMYEAPFEPD
jgi:hypothetical protein